MFLASLAIVTGVLAGYQLMDLRRRVQESQRRLREIHETFVYERHAFKHSPEKQLPPERDSDNVPTTIEYRTVKATNH